MQRAQIENGEFENIESEYAKLGTAAHELCARSVSEGCEPFEFLGEDFSGYIAGWPDGISLDAAHIYFNECQAIMDRSGHKGWMIVEKTYHLPKIHPLLRGTVDFGYISNQGIFLRDFKNGAETPIPSPSLKSTRRRPNNRAFDISWVTMQMMRGIPVIVGVGLIGHVIT